MQPPQPPGPTTANKLESQHALRKLESRRFEGNVGRDAEACRVRLEALRPIESFCGENVHVRPRLHSDYTLSCCEHRTRRAARDQRKQTATGRSQDTEARTLRKRCLSPVYKTLSKKGVRRASVTRDIAARHRCLEERGRHGWHGSVPRCSCLGHRGEIWFVPLSSLCVRFARQREFGDETAGRDGKKRLRVRIRFSTGRGVR